MHRWVCTISNHGGSPEDLHVHDLLAVDMETSFMKMVIDTARALYYNSHPYIIHFITQSIYLTSPWDLATLVELLFPRCSLARLLSLSVFDFNVHCRQ